MTRAVSLEPHKTPQGAPTRTNQVPVIVLVGHRLGIYPGALRCHPVPFPSLAQGHKSLSSPWGQPGPCNQPKLGSALLQHQAGPKVPWADIVLDMGRGPWKGVVWPQCPPLRMKGRQAGDGGDFIGGSDWVGSSSPLQMTGQASWDWNGATQSGSGEHWGLGGPIQGRGWDPGLSCSHR